MPAATVRSRPSSAPCRGAAPGAPTNLSASPGNAMVTLSWTAVATATSLQRLSQHDDQRSGEPAARDGREYPGVRRHAGDERSRPTSTRSPPSTRLAKACDRLRPARARRRPTTPPPPPPRRVIRRCRQRSASCVKRRGARVLATSNGCERSAPTDSSPNSSVRRARSIPPRSSTSLSRPRRNSSCAFALTGQDQLRQRMAWALHKIWVVSAVEVTNTSAILTYHGLLIGRRVRQLPRSDADHHAQPRDGPLPQHAQQPRRVGRRVSRPTRTTRAS